MKIENIKTKNKTDDKNRKDRIKHGVNKIILIRKQQIEILENNLIKPLKDSKKLYEDFLKGKQSFQNVERHTNFINKHLSEILRINEVEVNSCLNNNK